MTEAPGVARDAKGHIVCLATMSKFWRIGLSNNHTARSLQPPNKFGVLLGFRVTDVQVRPERRHISGSIFQILNTDRNASER